MRSTASTAVFLTTLLSVVSAQTNSSYVTGTLGNATVVENNPPNITYVAVLPKTGFAFPNLPNVVGNVTATSSPDGIGVNFEVNFSGFPTSGGPFSYHIHQSPVSGDGNCTNTGGHLDPFNRTEVPACNSALKQTCQVGDLAGKWGKIEADPFHAKYLDLWAATAQDSPSFFGNRSIVVHYANKTRITCANFTLSQGTPVLPSNSTTAAPTTVPTSPVPFTGSAGLSNTAVSTISLLGVATLVLILGQE